jgi:hypothetical protein
MARPPPTELDALRAQLAHLEELNRRLAEAEVANSEQRVLITRILEAVPGGIVHVGAKGDCAIGQRHRLRDPRAAL